MKKRRNFLPSFLVTLLFSLLLTYIILFIPPDSVFNLFLFYLILFLLTFFIFAFIFANSRRGFLLSLCLVLILFLKQEQLLSWLNFILVLGIGFSVEIYFSKTKKSSRLTG
jgi:hypothetical protein